MQVGPVAAAWRGGLVVSMIVWLGAVPAEAAKCTFSTTSVSFGTYNVFAPGASDSIGTITYECNGGAKHVVVAITAGGAGSFGPRALAGQADALAYNLFRDAARTSVWGDGSGGSQPVYVGDPPNKVEQTLTIFARIPPGQDVRAGSYADGVAVVIQY